MSAGTMSVVCVEKERCAVSSLDMSGNEHASVSSHAK